MKVKRGVRILGSFLSATATIFAVSILGSVPSGAFSAYGSGTQNSPYRIATCAQLQEIEDDLSGYYTLVSDIDCSGFAFTAIGPTFTGTLDGKNHTIAHLDIAEEGNGLFGATDGATIQNLKIASGSIGSGNYSGSFVGSAENTTLTNVHSSMTIVGNSRAGGLIGQTDNGVSIDRSSFSGSLVAISYMGGLVGLMYENGVNTITNSYFDGTMYVSMASFPLTNPGTTAGGLVGLLYGGTISNSYSVGAIGYDDDTPYVGGLVGITYDGIFNNLFTSSTLTGDSGVSIGAGFGVFYSDGSYSSAATNVQFDSTLAPYACAGTVTGSGLSCTSRNVGNSAPNFFKNNSTNVPFTSWNFSTIWQTTSQYPTLRALASFSTPAGIPNNGDANADGINDAYQANVRSVQDVAGNWTTITVPANTGCTIDDQASINRQSVTGDSYAALTNLTGFSVYCKNPGTSVAVTVIYDTVYSNPLLRFYNSNTTTYATITGATFATQSIGGILKTTATYTLTDGGSYDLDGSQNGVIVDPVMLAQAGVPNTGVRQQNTVAITIIIAVAISITMAIMLKLNQAHRSTK